MNAADRKKAKRLYDGLCSKCRPSAQSFLAKQVRKAFKPMKKARIQQEKQKRLTRKEETRLLREAVFARAKGRCEFCLFKPPTEMHHLLGGIGRRRQKQAKENCVAICRYCHNEYHADPSRFALPVAAWCAGYGYPPIVRIEHAPLFKSSTPSVPEADTPLPDKGIGGVDSNQEQLSGKEG